MTEIKIKIRKANIAELSNKKILFYNFFFFIISTKISAILDLSGRITK